MSDLTLVDNIWSDATSNKGRALIYFARASAIISEAIQSGSAHKVCSEGRICRTRLAIAVGCSRAVLTQNLNIFKMIQRADKLLNALIPTVAGSRLLQELQEMGPPQTHPTRLPRNSLFSCIVLARTHPVDAAFIPTIVFADGIHEASADWLRHFVDECGEPSSAFQYAKLLRAFLLYCRKNRLDWKKVSDRELKLWRDCQEKKGRTRKHINVALGVIFQFYCFCETRGILRYRVGCVDRLELPERLRAMQFPITAEPVYRGAKHQRAGWATPLLYRNTGNSIGRRQTPNDKQMADLHALAISGKTGDRDDLILSWFEDTAGRGMEVLQVTVNQIPSGDIIDELYGDPNPWLPIEIPRSKSGSGCTLVVCVDTLIATRAYILGPRASLVAHRKAIDATYEEPPNLFLSNKTGKALTRGAVTAKFKPLFRQVGLDDANVHRVRAWSVMDYFESLIDKLLESGIQVEPGSAWMETILQQASLKLGHRSPLSLRHYLTVALQRRIRTAEAAIETSTRRASMKADVALRQALAQMRAATQLLDDVRSSATPTSIAATLRRVAADYEAIAME